MTYCIYRINMKVTHTMIIYLFKNNNIIIIMNSTSLKTIVCSKSFAPCTPIPTKCHPNIEGTNPHIHYAKSKLF